MLIYDWSELLVREHSPVQELVTVVVDADVEKNAV
jgi:hypothetical protein